MNDKIIYINKTYRLPSVVVDRVEEVRAEKGFTSGVAALIYCVSETHGKMIRNERRTITVGTTDDKLSVEEKRQQRLEEKAKRIAATLDAKLVPSGDSFTAEWFTYSRTTKYPQRMPLLALTEDLIENQYFPSKEICLELIAREEEAKKINNEPGAAGGPGETSVAGGASIS